MSEVAPAISVADIYNSLLATMSSNVPSPRRRQLASSPAEIERQCCEIDELWCELGYCIQTWRNRPVEFIATRFANMHYVGVVNKVDSAKPPEEVWQYLVEKITQQVYGRIVIMRHREHSPGRIYAWK